MNPRFSFLILTAALTGLGCAPKAPVAVNPCQWLPRADVAEVAEAPVRLVEPITFPGGEPGCDYFTGEREPLLQVVADTRSVEQVVSETRNLYPTDRQPAITQLNGVGQSAILITVGDAGFMIYGTTGSKGFILSNVGSARIDRAKLTELAKRLFNSN